MDGFAILTNLSTEAEKVITQLAIQPVDVLCTGVSMVAVPMMMIWILYKGYMIMGGFQEAYLPAVMKDYAIRFLLLLIAGTSGFYLSNVQNLMKDTPMAMAKDLSGETKVLTIVEDKMIVAFDGLDKLNSTTPTPQTDPANTSKTEKVLKAIGKWAKVILPAANVISAGAKAFAGIWSVVVIFIKLMIISAALLYLAIALTKVILITKIGFMLCLGFGPLFLMFAAFDKTRGWFQGWLNYTIGLGMSYVVIMFSAKILLTILDALWQDGVSWLNVFGAFFVCIALAVIIGRMGDIASAWFGAGNIADGTAAAAAIAMGGMAGRVKGMAQTVGGNAKEGAVRGVGAWRNRGQAKMSRYNTRRTYEKNKKEEAAEKAADKKSQQNSSASIGKGN